MRARDLTTAPLITVQPGTSAEEAAGLRSTHGFTALPVSNDDEGLIGILTRGAIVRVLARNDSAGARDVQHRLEIHGSDRHVAQRPAFAVPGVVAAGTAYAGEEQTR
jgi:CBS domain-containing protein